MSAGPFQPGRICLGWRYAPRNADPGGPPRRPVPPDPERLNPGWLAAQRAEEKLISRPAVRGACCCLVLAAGAAALGVAGLVSPALAGLGAAVFAVVAARNAATVRRGRQALKASVAAEARRVAAAREVQERELFAAQEEHARRFRAWQASQREFAGQALWHPVVLPAETDRIDLAGGTMAGWSAALTMVGGPLLAGGGEMTVIDLSEGAVARDLVALAGRLGSGPLVWVLPGDLPRFDLGLGLPGHVLADVLAACVAADLAGTGGHDPARDHALLARLLEVLGDGARISQVTAALRVLAQIGDPGEDVRRGLLTAGQLERITGLFGRGAADRVVIERAWSLEARLRVLDRLGADPVPMPPGRLRVVAADPVGGPFGNGVLGCYVTVTLTHLLRRARAGRPWRHAVWVAGAQLLPGEVIDRLAGACEASRTGLVLAYRSIPPHVRERLGRGNAALAVMRLGNAEDAKAASEQIGAEHRFVLSQFTDTVGASVTDTFGDSYTSTVGTAWSVSVSESRNETSGESRGRGHTRAGAAAFGARTGTGSSEASESQGTGYSESLTDGISTSTSWGLTTSRAIGLSDSLARTVQRSRELLVEPHELQRLPPSAVILSYASGARRHVVLADANPAIATLPATALDLTTGPPGGTGPPEAPRGRAGSRRGPAGAPGAAAGGQGGPRPAAADGGAAEPGQPVSQPVSWRSGPGRPPPNLGPPPEPPDWRRR